MRGATAMRFMVFVILAPALANSAGQRNASIQPTASRVLTSLARAG